jgi:two-component system, NarL family, response regulator DegU
VNAAGPIRVLIADDHQLFAQTLMTSLTADDRIDVIGIAADGLEAVKLAMEYQPDVVLMDINMPRSDGIEATRRLRDRGCPSRVILLTGGDLVVDSADVTSIGASAFLTKAQSLDELLVAFFDVASLAVAVGSGGATDETVSDE